MQGRGSGGSRARGDVWHVPAIPWDLVRAKAAAATATASLLALSTPPETDGWESIPGETGPEAGVEMEPP